LRRERRVAPHAEVDDLCEDWMKHADQVLADELLVAAVYEALAKRRPKSRSRGWRGQPNGGFGKQ